MSINELKAKHRLLGYEIANLEDVLKGETIRSQLRSIAKEIQERDIKKVIIYGAQHGFGHSITAEFQNL